MHLAAAEYSKISELEWLRPEWEALWARCPGATVFQSPAWLIPWWKHLGRGELWVVSIRHHQKLIGVAPFLIHRNSAISARELLFLGTGISDYLDLLLEPEFRQAGVAFVLDLLASQDSRWDTSDFQQLPPGANLLQAQASLGSRCQTSPQEVC